MLMGNAMAVSIGAEGASTRGRRGVAYAVPPSYCSLYPPDATTLRTQRCRRAKPTIPKEPPLALKGTAPNPEHQMQKGVQGNA